MKKQAHQNRFEYKSKTCITIADGTILYVEPNKTKNEMETTKLASDRIDERTNERASKKKNKTYKVTRATIAITSKRLMVVKTNTDSFHNHNNGTIARNRHIKFSFYIRLPFRPEKLSHQMYNIIILDWAAGI